MTDAPRTTTPRTTTAVYNPHLLRKDELVATFAARQPLLDYLVDQLRRGGHQHHLLVGQRGAGKTTMLLRLAYAIEDDAKLGGKALALRFPEEQYNVHRVSDLWLNCVDALIDRLEQQGELTKVRALEGEVERIGDLEDATERATQALAVLTGWARQVRRTLVLLIDNLDLVLDRLHDHHWALREVLSEDNRLVVIGGSSTHVQETFTYDSAFYDFFAVHELGPLDAAEARAMLLRLADATEAPRVKEALAEPGRFEALHLFSGGMPRTMVLLLRLLATEGTRRAEEDLERLLDQVTPYYKARFEELPTQSQVVVGALALHYHPMTAAECAKQTGIEVTVVSAQLSRLVKQGVVMKLPSADSSKLSFLIGERLFAIWYAMRNSRRLRRRLFSLVDAVKAFYGQPAIDGRARELLAAVCDPDRLLAFASHVEDPMLRMALETRAVRDLVLAMEAAPLGEALDLEGEDRHLAPVAERVRALEEIRRHVEAHGAPQIDRTNAAAALKIVSFPFVPLATKRRIAGLADRASVDEVDEMKGRASAALLSPIQPFIRAIGMQLAAATASGSVPALPDVATAAEADAVWRAIDAGDQLNVATFIVATAGSSPSSTSAIARLLALTPSAAVGCFLAVLASEDTSGVAAASTTLARLLTTQNETSIGAFADPDLWQSLARSPHAATLAATMAESKWADRLAPLVEALRAAGQGRRGDLVYLAPELRKPAEAILARWFRDDDKGSRERVAAATKYVVPRGGGSRAAESKPTTRTAKAARGTPAAAPSLAPTSTPGPGRKRAPTKRRGSS